MMGYYSRYTLKAEPLPENLGDAIEDHDELNYAFERDGSMADSTTWYDWREDMAAFSKRFPGVLFTVRREGGGAGDIEIGYFRDGLGQLVKAVLTFDPFDESKLAPISETKGGK